MHGNLMNYEKLYKKYKHKYSDLKKMTNQRGGAKKATVDVEYVVAQLKLNVSNSGQFNCGIIYVDEYVVKCLGKTSNMNDISGDDVNYTARLDKINKIVNGLSPEYYHWDGSDSYLKYIKINNEDDDGGLQYARCIIMDKLDGDLTSYIFKKSYKQTFGNMNDYQFYHDRLKKTHGYTTMYNTEDIVDKNKFDGIISAIRPNMYTLCVYFNIKIIMLHHNLLQSGWIYNDYKLDNICYKIIDGEIKLYFIDEVGFVEIIDDIPGEDNMSKYIDVNFINFHASKYGIFGQYNLQNQFNIGFDNFVNPLELKIDEIKTKLMELTGPLSTTPIKKFIVTNVNTQYKWISIRREGHNNIVTLQFIQGIYRLVSFDSHNRHMSNANYETLFKKVDVLCYTFDEACHNIYYLFDV
jgi:hypothetical protein